MNNHSQCEFCSYPNKTHDTANTNVQQINTKKSCENCACIEYRLNSTVCILNGIEITEVDVCEKWEPSSGVELVMLRDKQTELLKEIDRLKMLEAAALAVVINAKKDSQYKNWEEADFFYTLLSIDYLEETLWYQQC